MLFNKEQSSLYNIIEDYDTLLISQDYDLFKQLISFLREFAPERKPILIDNPSSLSAFENSFNSCDIMICDISTNSTVPELTSFALDSVSKKTLSVGIVNSYEKCKESLAHPLTLKLAGIIDNKNGWVTTWRKISALKKAWDNPVMISRIEEIHISDILQMIAACRWSSIVFIEGYTENMPSKNEKPLRGSISFLNGEPHTAWSWKNIGVEAIFDLLSIKEGFLQVMKNLSPTPVRNVYLQMDEILLSHAVSIDEQLALSQNNCPNISLPVLEEHISLPPSTKSLILETLSQNKQEPEISKLGKNDLLQLKSKDNNIIIDTIKKSTPHSFFLRWMNEEELRRIIDMLLSQGEETSNCIVCYGNEHVLSRFFSSCAKGFAADKLQSKLWIPVMRCGVSLDKCLYFAGLDLDEEYSYLNTLPCMVFISSSSDWEEAERKIFNRHKKIFVLSEINTENISSKTTTKDFYIIENFEFNWQKLIESLISIVKNIEGDKN